MPYAPFPQLPCHHMNQRHCSYDRIVGCSHCPQSWLLACQESLVGRPLLSLECRNSGHSWRLTFANLCSCLLVQNYLLRYPSASHQTSQANSSLWTFPCWNCCLHSEWNCLSWILAYDRPYCASTQMNLFERPSGRHWRSSYPCNSDRALARQIVRHREEVHRHPYIIDYDCLGLVLPLH